MLNQVILVGRISNEVSLVGDTATLILKVPRSVKNEQGEYENDFIPCVVSGNIATNVVEYCKKEDIVGVKGRVQSTTTNMPDGTISTKIDIFAEKVTFLSSKSA